MTIKNEYFSMWFYCVTKLKTVTLYLIAQSGWFSREQFLGCAYDIK